MRIVLVATLLAAALLPTLPTAAATHPCEEKILLHQTPGYTVSAYRGSCAGVDLWVYFLDCHQAHWGVEGSGFGVGGHHGCNVYAYALLA